MQRTKRVVPRLVLTLMALAALTFGAKEAMAANAAMVCPYYPPTQLGECIDPGSCQIRCEQQPEAEEGSFGLCDGGTEMCCVCRL